MCHQPRHHFPGSKGCAIVEYRTAAEARRAIRSMTDTELRGRLLGLGVGMGWGLLGWWFPWKKAGNSEGMIDEDGWWFFLFENSRREMQWNMPKKYCTWDLVKSKRASNALPPAGFSRQMWVREDREDRISISHPLAHIQHIIPIHIPCNI